MRASSLGSRQYGRWALVGKVGVVQVVERRLNVD